MDTRCGSRHASRRGAAHKRALERGRRLVRLLGGDFYLLPQSARLYGSAGLPDARVYLRGCALFWECKVGRDRLSPKQAEFKRLEESAGGTVVVGDDVALWEWMNGDRRE